MPIINNYKDSEVKCIKCDTLMKQWQACHLICPNCGAHLDCSDKGSVW